MTGAQSGVDAIITARGGSKGIPGKNLRTVHGRSLLAHAVEAARGCRLIDRVAVTTDDAEIAAAASELGAIVIDRPAELATDGASSADAVVHALTSLAASGVPAGTAVLLQPTSPLRTAEHVTQCIEDFLKGGYSAAVSMCRTDAHPWKMLVLRDGSIAPVAGWESLERPRQALPAAYRPNGAIYVVKVSEFLRQRSFFLQPLTMFEMSPQDSIDIDTEEDLVAAELATRERETRRQLATRWGEAKVRFSKSIDMRKLNRTPGWRREIAADQAALSAKLGARRRTLGGCPVCGEASHALFVRVFEFDYVQCSRCGHLYSKTPPDEDAVRRLYAGDGVQDDRSVQHKVYMNAAVYQKRVADIALPKVRYVSEFAPDRGRWYDIGCGVGEIVTAAARFGWRSAGIESDRKECEFARSMGAEVTQDYLTEKNAAALLREAKVVSFFNVLEHIADPAGLLRAVMRAVPDGCLVAAEVPHHPSLSSLSNRLFPEMACRHIYAPDHLHAFTDESLGRMIGALGIRPLGLWYFGQDYFDLLCSAAAARGLEATELYDRAVDVAPEVQAVIDRSGLADTMLLVGAKGGDGAGAWRAASA